MTAVSRLSNLLAGAVVALAPLAARAQPALTLQEAVDLAQKRGLPARAAASSRTAAQAAERAFSARRLPQLSFSTAPSYNRSIIPVVQPDGTTLFTPLQTTEAVASMTLSQRLPFSGGTFP